MKKYVLSLLIIGFVLSACSAKNQDASAALLGSWKLNSYDSVPAVTHASAELTFNDNGTITGNSGCNGFGGKYKVAGDQVTFSEVDSTLMACDEPHMSQEGAVHQVLNNAATFKIEGNRLTLTNHGNVLVLNR